MSRKRYIIYLCCTVALMVVVGLEILIRHEARKVMLLETPNATSLQSIMTSGFAFWEMKPNVQNAEIESLQIQFAEAPVRPFSVSTNEWGARVTVDNGGLESGDGYQIIAIGDSTTFGLGVDDHETWPALVSQEIAIRLDVPVNVVNAGVTGYSCLQCVEKYRELRSRVKPDIVVATFGTNDRQTWDGISDYERMEWWAGLNPEARGLRIASLLNLLLQKQLRKSGIAEGYVHPKPRMLLDDFRACMAELSQSCKADGTKLVFIVWPLKDQAEQGCGLSNEYQVAMGEFAAMNDITLVFPCPEFSKRPNVYFDTIHVDEEGNRIVAELVVDTLEKLLVSQTS